MFYDLLKTRRSIRKFKDKEIEKEKVKEILNCGLLSPSSRRRRPWEFIVVTDKDKLVELSKSREHSSAFLAGAPLGIVVLADSKACDVWIEDTSIASIIIQLSAHSIGLGSCWIQVRDRMHSETENVDDYIKRILNVPDNLTVECMVAIGYPDEEKEEYSENDLLLDKIHYEKY